MPEAHYQPGQSFSLQFAWRLPNGDYLRHLSGHRSRSRARSRQIRHSSGALFGRPEDEADGRVKPLDELKGEYWTLVRELSGRTSQSPATRRMTAPALSTTGDTDREHNFFTRYEDAR